MALAGMLHTQCQSATSAIFSPFCILASSSSRLVTPRRRRQISCYPGTDIIGALLCRGGGEGAISCLYLPLYSQPLLPCRLGLGVRPEGHRPATAVLFSVLLFGPMHCVS
jgi:hypothetical protein